MTISTIALDVHAECRYAVMLSVEIKYIMLNVGIRSVVAFNPSLIWLSKKALAYSCHQDQVMTRGVPKLTGGNLKLVWAEFSNISQAVSMMCMYFIQVDARPHLQLKTRGERKPTHLTSVFSLRTSVLTSAKAVSVVPSGSDKMDVHGCQMGWFPPTGKLGPGLVLLTKVCPWMIIRSS